MYLKGGHFAPAARLSEEMGDLAAASLYYLKAGDLKAAGEAELRQNNKEKAAWMFSRAGQHQRAAELLESIDQPEAAAAEFDKGGFRDRAALLYVKAGKHMVAARLFEALIQAGSKSGSESYQSESDRSLLAKYHRYCGELYFKAEQGAKAAPHFEKAQMLDQAAEAWKQAGEMEKAADLLLKLQRPDDAYAVLEESGHAIDSLSPGIQAELLQRKGKHREAAEVLEKSGSMYRAAEAWTEAGDLTRAAQLFEKEGEVDRAAQLYVQAGRQAEAGRIYEAARDFKSAADLYRQAGQLDDAARVLLKADDPIAAARLHYEKKNFEECIKALQKVTSDHKDYRKASFLLGRVFAEQGLHQLAIDGQEVGDETVLVYYSLALAHEANLRPREAVRIFQKILSYDYGYKDVLTRMRESENQPLARLGARGSGRHEASESGWSEPDRYRIERSLGTGKLGEVFRGTDTALGRPVAIRRIHEGPGEAGKADRFLKEAAATARLGHPNVVTTYDTGADGKGKFVVTSLADGRPLRALLDERVRFELNRIVAIGRQILEALAHAHERGVLHRNLRPENIFITDDDRVTVSDFALNVRLSDLTPGELNDGRLIRYTPPEMLLKERVDERSDLYSFGIVLYELATGQSPFQGKDVGHQQVHATVAVQAAGARPLPDFLKAVILRCLEKDKEKRYKDARSVLDDLKLKEVVPGMVVGDRYEVLAEIGRGGMGAIFRARDVELDETVALKFLAGNVDAEMANRLVQEIKTARSITHTNVVRVFNLDKWDDHRFIVMEYIDGLPLPRFLQRAPAPTREDRLRLAVQIASALDAAHAAGVIHRDIKPDNILVAPPCEVKVLDFGIARAEASGHTMTAAGTVVGSPMYMSPEQMQAQPVDRRSDIYSLGAVLYFMFTGVEPFAGKDVQEIMMKHLRGRPRPPHEVEPSVPRPLSDAIMRCLEVDPGRRFPSAGDLAAVLTGTLKSSAA